MVRLTRDFKSESLSTKVVKAVDEQAANRPTKTPEGLDFPYSHFGDTNERTKLLIKIAEAININPKIVVNVGCGYDITPSDAFTDARVIHVDVAPEVVNFLSESGFEACEPDNLPQVESDLSISILGGDPEIVPLSEHGVILSTSKSIPENMGAVALVDTSQPPKIVTDNDEMEELWYSDNGQNVHLVATKKLKEEK